MRIVVTILGCSLLLLLISTGAKAQICNNWVNLPSRFSYLTLGDLDVTGDKITVEALINRTVPYTGGQIWAGDIVSKHNDPINTNYLLRPNSAEITTTRGYFKTPDICDIKLNKTYHVAMVYDGASLRFYRNGFLMSQIAVSGNMIVNDLPARIGLYSSAFYNEDFFGFVNEVRIWNVARSQNEIKTYMRTSLPTPATQKGLLAYYTFDNLKNKQGDARWDATITGSAIINSTNPTCASFVEDSCCTNPQGILTGSSICSGTNGTLTFTSTQGSGPFTIQYSDGITTYTQTNIQSGMAFNLAKLPSNTTTYTLVSIKDASGCSNTTFQQPVTAAVMVKPLPQGTLSGSTICKGSQGTLTLNTSQGLAPFEVKYSDGSITYTAINVISGVPFSLSNTPANTTDFFITSIKDGSGCTSVLSTPVFASVIVKPAVQGNLVGSAVCEGTNGTLTFNSIQGVDPFELTFTDGTNTFIKTNVTSGTAFSLPIPISSTTIYTLLTIKDASGCLAIQTSSPPAIVSVKPSPSGTLSGNLFCEGTTPFLTFLATQGTGPFSLNYSNGIDTLSAINIKSGQPITLPALPSGSHYYTLISVKDANVNGCTTTALNAKPVLVKINPLPEGNIIGNTVCIGSDGTLTLNAKKGTSPFELQYSDGMDLYTATNIQNNASFSVTGSASSSTYTLISIKDSEGCAFKPTDPTPAIITFKELPQGGIIGATVCAGDSASIIFNASVTNASFEITLFDGISNKKYSNIQAGQQLKIFYNDTTKLSLYSIKEQTLNGCIRLKDFLVSDAMINIKPKPQIQFNPLPNVCSDVSPFAMSEAKETFGLMGTGAYSGSGISNTEYFSPSIAGTGLHTITYTHTATNGCSASKSQVIKVNGIPVIKANPDINICKGLSTQLHATGGVSYRWFPALGLNSDTISNPLLVAGLSAKYTVEGTDVNGCKNRDDVNVNVITAFKLEQIPNVFSPNNDGINDVWVIPDLAQFSNVQVDIFNRTGQLMYSSTGTYKPWDGKYLQKALPAATYYYIIETSGICKQKVHGPITILY